MPFPSLQTHFSNSFRTNRINLTFFLVAAFKYSSLQSDVENVAKAINDFPFPDKPLTDAFHHLHPSLLSTNFVEGVLGKLFAWHSNGLKALEFFRFSLRHPNYTPSSDAFEKTLHILARMRYFDLAWEFMSEVSTSHPSLLTIKSMSILLSRIAKFGSFKDTLEAFERMEKEVFSHKQFGVDEFNVLLKAFCTQRRNMKDVHHVFVKMLDRFQTNTKTMNIILLGFKETGDITSVELFYHDLRRRGFQSNNVTFGIRIDAFCKKGYFADGVRLLNEMEQANHKPSIQLLTTLIHGAGIARNPEKAWEFFHEIGKRGLQTDVASYNALISALVKCRDMKSAVNLISEMEKKGMTPNDVTYRTVLFGLMKSREVECGVELCQKMKGRNFVPKAGTMVMVVKYLCTNGEIEEAIRFWGYVIETGCGPHRDALHYIVAALCSRGRVDVALELSKQFVERGMRMKKETYEMLERSSLEEELSTKLKDIKLLMSKMTQLLPPSNIISFS